MPAPLVLYLFKLRNPVTQKWYRTRHRMTIEEATARHGEGNYQVREWSKEERQVTTPGATSAAHLSGPRHNGS